jgi:hypothetical protein
MCGFKKLWGFMAIMQRQLQKPKRELYELLLKPQQHYKVVGG